MNAYEQLESELLETILPRYEAEGYKVFVHPSPSILPNFLQRHRPDAIALGQQKKIAIEVIQSNPNSARRVREMQSAFAEHGDWELRIYYVSPRSSESHLASMSRAEIDRAIQEVEALARSKHTLSALVLSWATLEGIGRALLFDRLKKAQSPARLVEVLASDGYVTPDEADFLRKLIPTRNSAVHGVLDIGADEQQIAKFLSVLRTLADLIPTEKN